MKLSKEELIEKVRAYVGDRTDDETISLIEDISDSMEVAADDDDENWKEKYEDLDNQWREKYIARFSEPSTVKEDEIEVETTETNSFDDLFEEKENE